MVAFKNFFHQPELDRLVQQLIADAPGLMIVAGLDPRPTAVASAAGNFLPSGRAAIFRTLSDELLDADSAIRWHVVTADPGFMRIPGRLRRRMSLSVVEPPLTYAHRLVEAARRRAGWIVLDRLDGETLFPAFGAAAKGIKVLTQLDTLFRGAEVARYLFDQGADETALGHLTWVLSVHRLPMLCPNCKQAIEPAPAQQEAFERLARVGEDCAWPDWMRRSASLGKSPYPQFFSAGQCTHCQGTGRQGDVAAVDVFRAASGLPDLFTQPSQLPLQYQLARMVSTGQIALDDALDFESDQLRRSFNLLAAREKALASATVAVERLQLELAAANRVLQQRTQVLFSLEDMSQTLISSTDLYDLAGRVCKRARDLCGADRSILYFERAEGWVTVLAAIGWDGQIVSRDLEIAQVYLQGPISETRPYDRIPPGVPADGEGVKGPKAGLYVPLVAQEKQVGLMIVHTDRKAQFASGEVALLLTFANHTALALQRAGLIEQLQGKIAQLESAQVELGKKERLERELELARQVQQSMLPCDFPQAPGYQFMAWNEPARQVGGDFYDIFLLDSEHFGVAIADVSDKGLPAALYMALTRSLLLAEARRERSPRAALANVNQILLELGEQNMFVTVFYGVVACSARRLTYARAGHDRPWLLRNGDTWEFKGAGLPLGLFGGDEFSLTEEQVALERGDRLVLYTDGLTDMLADDGEIFGKERLQALFQELAGLPLDGLGQVIFARLLLIARLSSSSMI